MRIQYLLLVFILSLLVSCQSGKNTVNEDKGIDEVLAIYGGKCIYGRSVSASTENGKHYSYDLEVSQSEFVDKFFGEAETLAGGVAYAFFKHLRDERKKYTHITTVLVNGKGRKLTYEFAVEGLEKVATKMPIVEAIASLIVKKDYQAIEPFIYDSSYIALDKNSLIESIRQTEAQLDSAIGFVPLGFRFNRMESHNNLHLVGQITRTGQSTEFSVDVNPDDRQAKAVKVDYKL